MILKSISKIIESFQKRFAKRIMYGERIPDYHRVAYYDCLTAYGYAYPIGLHIIVKWIRRFWEWSLIYNCSRLETYVTKCMIERYDTTLPPESISLGAVDFEDTVDLDEINLP